MDHSTGPRRRAPETREAALARAANYYICPNGSRRPFVAFGAPVNLHGDRLLREGDQDPLQDAAAPVSGSHSNARRGRYRRGRCSTANGRGLRSPARPCQGGVSPSFLDAAAGRPQQATRGWSPRRALVRGSGSALRVSPAAASPPLGMECSTNELTAAFCGCGSEAGGDRAPVYYSSSQSGAGACEEPLGTPPSVCQRERCPASRVWRNGWRIGVGSRHGHPHNCDRRSRHRRRHRRDPVRSLITLPLAVSEE